MNKLRDIFFQLLRMGLWGQGSLHLPEPLSAKDWNTLYEWAKTQTVEGIIFDAFALLLEDQLPPLPLRMKWAVRTDQIERLNQQMSQTIAEQYTYFTAQGLQPLLLKGQGVASCYPQPGHRNAGDVDWYFSKAEYEQAYQSVLRKGIAVSAPLNFTLSYDWNQIPIEHQAKIFDLRSLFKLDYLNKLQADYQDRRQIVKLGGVAVPILAPEMQILQVNIHILKHLLSFGIGLRQINDAAILYHAYKDQIDAKALQRIYKKLGILPWIHLLHHLLVKHIGLAKEELPFPYPEKLNADWMFEEIWQSGNFGFHDERFMHGKVGFGSKQPEGAKRIMRNLKLYYKYAPQEVVFFPLRRITARVQSWLKR